jgi:glutathione synthase/RimK-type ligase-like ATP-grasp enzyme
MRVAFVTGAEWAELNADDAVAAAALGRRGVRVDVPVWNDSSVDWASFDAVVLRSCWDYWREPAAFAAWIGSLETAGVRLWNPAATVLWNVDKLYLAELEERGVSIVPSAFPEPGTDLGALLEERGWDRAVVKPRVSADGHRTKLVRRDGAHREQRLLDEIAASGGAIVQEYVDDVVREGEYSFVFIDGTYSHAALKVPAPSDFRVQPRLGGTAVPALPHAELIAQAERVMEAVELPWLYARVDGCVRDGMLLLMELELIEPTLFFAHAADAADMFAAAILQRHTA